MTLLGNVTKESRGPEGGPDLGCSDGWGVCFGVKEGRAEGVRVKRCWEVSSVGSSGTRRVMALFLAAVGEETTGIKRGQRRTFLMSRGKRWTWWSSG